MDIETRNKLFWLNQRISQKEPLSRLKKNRGEKTQWDSSRRLSTELNTVDPNHRKLNKSMRSRHAVLTSDSLQCASNDSVGTTAFSAMLHIWQLQNLKRHILLARLKKTIKGAYIWKSVEH